MSAQRPALEIAARLGYAGRGTVYVIVGGFAVLAAMGSGRAKGQNGALETVLRQPLGEALLAAVALGFLCFCVWRLLQAFLDADHDGRERKALARRAVYAVSAFVYAGLAIGTVTIMLGNGAGEGGGDQSARDWTAYLLAKPFGQWLVGAAAATIAGVGIAMGIRGCKTPFESRLACNEAARAWVVPLGRLGFLARGSVFLLVAAFLARAALHANSREAHGVGGALRTLQQEPYGSTLLGVTAFGLFAFGAFQFAVAAYRRIDAPTLEEAAREAEDGARKVAQAG